MNHPCRMRAGGLLAVAFVALQSASPQNKGSAEKGNEVFDEQCSSCHNAYSSEKKTGPGLKLLFARDKLESNGKPVTDANVQERIDRGGNGMPAYKDTLSADDKADLLAYLKTL